MLTAEQIIDDLIRREDDRYTHDEEGGDPPTKYGVTLYTLAAYRKMPVTPEDVMALTESEARAIFLSVYIIQPGFDAIEDPALRGLLVDSAVQHDPRDAVIFLQNAVGAKPDGILGPKTRAAMRALPPRLVYKRVLCNRNEYYGALIVRRREKAKYALGWARRMNEFILEA